MENIKSHRGSPRPNLPEKIQRKLVAEIAEWVAATARGRAAEVLEDPYFYGESLNEIRWSIAGYVAMELEHDLGEWIEATLEEHWPEDTHASQ